jgi:type 1 glutamine amidotransferase
MLTALLCTAAISMADVLVFEGSSGPGKGKHIVLLAGDEEYRSEEMLPQFARILSRRYGFRCTVGFALDEKGFIDPEARGNQSGLNSLSSADLCVIMLRFRTWPEHQMKEFADYVQSGKPIVAIRTSTHAFDYPPDSTSAYRRFGWRSKDWPGGFGKQILGENWISHWGNHGSQATRGIKEGAHPMITGVDDVFVPTDVYEAHPPSDAQILMRGQVVAGMSAGDPPATGDKKDANGRLRPINDPMMPVAWTRELAVAEGRKRRVFVTTMGSSQDFQNPGFRKLLVNAVHWAIGQESPRPQSFEIVGQYLPSPFGFGGFKKSVRPADLQLP